MAQNIIISSGNVKSGEILNANNSMTVLNGGTASEISATYSYLYVSSGGSAINTNLNTYGFMYVFSEGIADSTFISGQNANLFVSPGGIANHTTVNKGWFAISEGGFANDITINSGTVVVSAGATASGIVVKTGGWLGVASGGTAVNVDGNPFDTVGISNGAHVTFASNITGVFYGSGGKLFSKAQTMDAKTISLYQSMLIIQDGVANRITVNSGGSFTVFSGGIVNRASINGSGLGVVSGGVANSTIVNNGYQAYLVLCDGGVANDTTVRGGMMISSGGTAYNTNLLGGAVVVSSGGTANNTNLFSPGIFYVERGGIANNTIFHSKGEFYLYGGTANSTIIQEAGCRLHVLSNGITNDTTICDHGGLILSEGTANNTVINNSGGMQLSKGWADSTTVNQGGVFYIFSGGIAKNTTVNSGGTIHVSSGGKITGKIAFENGAYVFAYSDSILDFDLTQVSPGNAPIIKDLSLISGTPNYTITVNGNEQPFGIYLLAEGVNTFTNSISVQDEFGIIGLLPTGKRTRLNGIDYKLIFTENTLLLLIDEADLTPPTVSNISASITAPTNQDVVITADYSDDVALEYSLYKLGEKGSWITYADGITVSENTTVFFKAVDESGNISEILSYEVANIDKIAPEKPIAYADSTIPTNQDVTVAAAFSEDSMIKEYSLNGSEWTDYTSAIKFSDNGSVRFRAKDAAGNISEITKYTVSNIDKIAPSKPTVSVSIMTPTRLDVTIAALFSNDSVLREYSLDGDVWTNYTDAIIFSNNGTAFFRGTDEAGNVSDITSYAVTNIDKTPPVKPKAIADITMITHGKVNVSATFSADTEIQEYSTDGINWMTYTGSIQFAENGVVFFRGTDLVGNVSEIERYNVTNIEKIIPKKPIISTVCDTEKNQAVITVVYDDNSTLKEYSQDGQTWKIYEGPITLFENATFYFRSTNEYDNVSEIAICEVSGLRSVCIISRGSTIDGVIPYPVFVLEGGEASNTVIARGDYMRIFNGGIASNTIVNLQASFYIESGGIVKDTTLSGGVLFISSGATANNTLMNTVSTGTQNHARIFVSSGGIANNVTVNSGCSLVTSIGGTATNIDAEKGAYLSLALTSNTYVEGEYDGCSFELRNGYLSGYSGLYPYFSFMTYSEGLEIDVYATGMAEEIKCCKLNVYSGGIANNISGGNLNVYSGGVASNVSMGKSNWQTSTESGNLCITNGGIANNVYVKGAGNLSVASGGTANNVVWTPYEGTIDIEDGAHVTFASQYSGVYYKYYTYSFNSESVITSTTIADFGGSGMHSAVESFRGYEYSSLYIMSGGTAIGASRFSEIYVYGGVLNNITYGEKTNIGAVYEIYGSNNIKVFSGGTANDIMLKGYAVTYMSAGCHMTVFSDGITNRTIILSCGRLDVRYGGIANDTVLSSGGRFYVSSGGTANRTIVNSLTNCFEISSGGIANDTVMNSGGCMYIASGGTANNVIWTPCIGTIDIENGAYVTFASQLYGVYNGAQDNLLIHSMTIESRVLGGSTYVFSGGVVNDVNVGALFIFSGGTANRTPANNMFVYKGGVANSALIEDITTFLKVHSGGTANNTVVSRAGKLFVSDGGVANNTTISYASMFVSSGGTTCNTMVDYGGHLYISSGGKITGRMEITDSATVSLASGAIIDFDLMQVSPETSALINKLSRISGGTCIYTLTIDGKQTDGIYNLAGGVTSRFNSTITVVNTFGTEFGTLSVNNSLTVGKKEYSLFLSNNNLLLNIVTKGSADTIKPSVTNIKANNTAPTNQNITVTADFYDDVAIASKLYKLGTGGTWLAYGNGVTVSQNTTVYFKAVDTSGNESTEASYTVSNIDKIPPTKPTVSANISSPTNGNVNVTATFSDDSTVREYSFDGHVWNIYSAPIVFEKNGTAYFRSSDQLGNTSDITSYTVDNIDKTAPEKPSVTANITTPINQNVIVTATFSEDTNKKEYSLDGQMWSIYSNGVNMTENGTVFFRATDTAGNVSDVASYVVNNIDKTLPEKPVASANITAPTNGNVTVSAIFSADSIGKQYSLDGQNWFIYTETVIVSTNGTVYFRGVDEAGNASEITSFVVGNIDKSAPDKPVAAADITAPTNTAVLVSATFSEDSAKQEYSLDGSTWEDYTNPIEFTENGEVFFRGLDEAGNVSEITTYKVANIDTTPPDKPVASADITTETNTGVVVSAVFSTDSTVREYSLDGQKWQTYTGGVTLFENGEVFFRGTDEAGNVSEVASYIVTNIDKELPVVSNVQTNIISPTKDSVTVTAVFADNVELKQSLYRIGDGAWTAYVDGVIMTENGTVYFKAVDTAGNESAEIPFVVSNVDRTPPEKPIASADITTPTKSNVTVAATFSSESISKEYSQDGQNWQEYTKPVELSQNGSVYFRGADEAGNISECETYMVSNIDRTPPDKPVATADITQETKSDVFVTAVFSMDSVKQDYSLDGQTWQPYVNGVTVTDNRTVYFRGLDEAGNESEVATYTVSNIDRIPPETPVATADITEPTNSDVLVSATFSTDSIIREYSLNGQDWKPYTAPILFLQNGIVYFKAMDAAGNISGVEPYTVNNIDKVAPDKPVATADITVPTNGKVHVSAIFNDKSVKKEYSLNGDNWLDYEGSIELAENGMVYFRSTDALGNVSEVTNYEVNNIDKFAPEKPTASVDIAAVTNQNVSVTATFSTDSVIQEYSTDGQTWKPYTDVVVLTANGVVSFRGTDEAGNVSAVTTYEVTNIDKVKPTVFGIIPSTTTPTNQDVIVTAEFADDIDLASKLFKLGANGTWTDYTDGVTVTENTTVYFKAVDKAGNESEEASCMVDNIDKVAPDKPTASADVTETTYGSVKVSAVFSGDSVKKEYSLDNGDTWQDYTAPIEFTANGIVIFRGKDEAGNVSEVASYEVANIETVIPDTTKPTVTNAKADITVATNQNVTVTADFADDTELTRSLYRIGEAGQWTDYVDGVTVTENATVFFKAADAAGNESEIVTYTVGNIDTIAPSAPSGLMAVVSDPTIVFLWSPSTDNASGIKEYVVKYSRNGQEFTATVNGTNYVLTDLAFGTWTWSVQAVDLAGNESVMTAGNSFDIAGAVVEPVSDVAPRTQTWEKTEENTLSVVEYSTDNFEHVIRIAVDSNSLDSFQMPAGNYQWRVKSEGSEVWTVGEPVSATATDNEPKLVKSDADGNADVFFANVVETWETGYVAQHVGSINDWNGTNEYAAVYGKNKLADIFEGSTDANILLLTDDDNGDSLFVDDIYTALPGSVPEQQSRIAQIDEIRAGAGVDIVDMTSQQFEYIGDGLTIRGGAGNDVIWANKGDNRLFGDAGNDRIVGASGDDIIAGGIGNDRMHGGGGDDIFTFGENWGTDTIEQLEGGKVTLWFASGSESNWNAETLTYSDGENSVKLTGVAADRITRIYGNNGSEQFGELFSMGAFFDATSERIFEESGKGILASL